MRIAICEDLEKDAHALRDMLEAYRAKHGLYMEIAVFSSAEELLAAFVPGYFHILFMDIFLKNLTGVDAVKKIRAQDEDCTVIFVTVSDSHAVDGFALRAAHYLIKPLDFASFCQAMERCKEQVDRFSRSIEVLENRAPVRVRIRDILYAEVFKNFCIIHTPGRDIKAYLSIDALESELEGESFFRCHRSYLVNLRRVVDVLEDRFLLEGGGEAWISRKVLAGAKKAYRDYCVELAEKTGVF